MSNQKVFYCYSKPLKNFLILNGEKYIAKATHEKTLKRYWIFLGSDRLNGILEEWKRNS